MDLSSASERWAKIALLWWPEIEQLSRDNSAALESASDNTNRLIELVVGTWLQRITGDLDHLKCEVGLIQQGQDDQWGTICSDMSKDEWGLILSPDANEPRSVAKKIGKALAELETLHPGLGETALDAMEDYGWGPLNLCSPAAAVHHASYVWWQGVDDNEELKEEYVFNGEEFESYSENIILPSQFKAFYPEWALSATAKLSVNELEAIAQASTSEVAREVATVLLHKQDWQGIKDANVYHVDEKEPVHFGAVLAWGDDDPCFRLIDDWYEYANYSGADCYGEEYCVIPVPLDPEQFLQWKKSAEMLFQQIRDLDRLLTLLQDQSGMETQNES